MLRMNEDVLHCAARDDFNKEMAKMRRFAVAYGLTGRSLADIQAEMAERRAMRRQDALDIDRAHAAATIVNGAKNRVRERRAARRLLKEHGFSADVIRRLS